MFEFAKGARPMRFTFRTGFIFAHADLSGSHVVMFGPNRKSLTFRRDLSNFNDQDRTYTWAFEWPQLIDGQQFVFATADRTIGARVFGSELRLHPVEAAVVRNGDGKPTHLVSPAAPARPRATGVAAPKPPVRTQRATLGGVKVPKVTVVTCSYNRPDMLRAAVESMRKQTDQDWEHLIFDDASTHPRVAATLEWAARDPRVRVWRGGGNIDRPASLWNFMLDRARGRYFTNLDDDNTKLPTFIEVMAGELDADPSLDIITCGWIVQDDRDGEPDSPYYLNMSTCTPELNRISTCDAGAMLYRRETFERAGYYSETIRTNEDWDWLRRANHTSTIKNLHECLVTYRSHRDNRMLRSADLGSDEDAALVKVRPLHATLGVRSSRPVPERLTRSQEDVCQSVQRALDAVPWVVERGDDLALIVSPFQMSPEDVRAAVGNCRRVLSLHMEDPYALSANLERIAVMGECAAEVWVCTNDASTVEAYQEVVGDRVIVCPSLGPDDQLAPVDHQRIARDIDVLLCGYAYPSRRVFVDKLLPLLGGLRVMLVGDGWEDRDVETLPTQDIESTRALHARAKTVICLHRTHGDCSDGPVAPESVCRGFMEGFFGPRVFLDRARTKHPFDDGDVVWYDAPADLAKKLREYLAGPRDPAADRYAEKCATIYTYRARLARVLNAVRTERFLAEIP